MLSVLQFHRDTAISAPLRAANDKGHLMLQSPTPKSAADFRQFRDFADVFWGFGGV